MKWYLGAWKKYAVFRGRARRKEFWMFYLFNMIILMIPAIFAPVALGHDRRAVELLLGLVGFYALAVILPHLAVTVRRLHDTNRSGWWFVVVFVPIIGGIILLIFLAQDSDEGDNLYGPDPKAALRTA